jgi:hypothetical protein
MPDSRLAVEIDGEALDDDSVKALVELVAEEAIDAADAVSIAGSLAAGASGQWTSVLDPLAQPRTPLVVTITSGDVSYRFEGASTEADWQIDAGGSSQLTVRALDKTLEMDLEEHVKSWPGTSDSVIATAIFGDYGLAAQVDDTPDGPDPDVHVVVQRTTDWVFLRALAGKWGYSTYIEADGTTLSGHFHAIDPLADPQATLSLGFGGDAQQVAISTRLTGGSTVNATRLGALSDSTETSSAEGTDQAQGSTPMGGRDVLLLAPHDVDGEIDVNAAVQGLARRAAFTVVLTVQLDVVTTGIMLRSRRTVLVKGLGDTLSGRYLVSRVRNRVTPAGHTQTATLSRNALGLSGDEPFGAGDLLQGLG